MIKKLIIRATSLVIALVMCSGLTSYASAYSLLGYRHRVPKVYYFYDNWMSFTARDAMVAGCTAWKSKTTKIVMEGGKSGGSGSLDVYVSAGSVPDVDRDGLTSYSWDGDGYFTEVTLGLNSAKPAWNDENALKSVVVHEIGHVFGLDDLYGGNRAIMNGYTYGDNSRYGTYNLTTPQTDDINGINYLY